MVSTVELTHRQRLEFWPNSVSLQRCSSPHMTPFRTRACVGLPEKTSWYTRLYWLHSLLLGKNSAAGPGLGWAFATQTCFPEASSSVPGPVLAPAPAWARVFHSLVLTSCVCSAAFVSLAPNLWAQPAPDVPCVRAFLHSACHPASLACSFWVERTPVSSLVIAWIDFLYLSTLTQGITCIYMGFTLL